MVSPRFLMSRISLTSVVVAFNSCKEWKKENWVVTTSKEEMRAEYAAWGPRVQKVIHAMEKPDIWALFNHLPCSTYYKGRVCLLGDAAHATTPHQGAGAGMCVEDALILSTLLKEVEGVEDFEKAFKAYDEVRRPRSQKNVATSREAGMLYDFEGEDIGDDLDKIEPVFKNRMKWIWDVDMNEEIERAKRIYHGAAAASKI
jgi:salicylate hydroxylase